MADIQQRDALRLLKLISETHQKKSNLTYGSAAELLGRTPPEKHCKAVAQMCDLLDAAACLAGVPLLALVAVRSKDGAINTMAWKKEYGPRRDAIINRSLSHNFSSSDFTLISDAIDDLGTRGNRNAWKYLGGLYPGDLLYRRLLGFYEDDMLDAIDDLGTDTPDRAKTETWSYARDPLVRKAVMKRANGTCEFCGKVGFMKLDETRYLESHHIIALANEGADKITNVIALCPDDHREAHFGENAKELELKMIKRVAAIVDQRR